jgi:hypothetical protein
MSTTQRQVTAQESWVAKGTAEVSGNAERRWVYAEAHSAGPFPVEFPVSRESRTARGARIPATLVCQVRTMYPVERPIIAQLSLAGVERMADAASRGFNGAGRELDFHADYWGGASCVEISLPAFCWL